MGESLLKGIANESGGFTTLRPDTDYQFVRVAARGVGLRDFRDTFDTLVGYVFDDPWVAQVVQQARDAMDHAMDRVADAFLIDTNDKLSRREKDVLLGAILAGLILDEDHIRLVWTMFRGKGFEDFGEVVLFHEVDPFGRASANLRPNPELPPDPFVPAPPPLTVFRQWTKEKLRDLRVRRQGVDGEGGSSNLSAGSVPSKLAAIQRSPGRPGGWGPGPRPGRPGDNPFVAPLPQPFARPTRGPSRDTGPAQGPQQAKSPNPPPSRSTTTTTTNDSSTSDARGTAYEARGNASDAKSTTSGPIVVGPPTDLGGGFVPATVSAPPRTDTAKDPGTIQINGDTVDTGTTYSETGTYDPDDKNGGGGSMPNPEDSGGGGEGPRATPDITSAPNPETTGRSVSRNELRVPARLRYSALPNPESRADALGSSDERGFDGGSSFAARAFDPKAFLQRLPGARNYGGPSDGGGYRPADDSSGGGVGGPRAYDAYPDPESSGGVGPKARYERPNPEDTGSPHGPSARTAISWSSATRNRMV